MHGDGFRWAVEEGVQVGGDGPAFGVEVDHFAAVVGEVELVGRGAGFGGSQMHLLMVGVGFQLTVEIAADEAVMHWIGVEAFVLEGLGEVAVEGFGIEWDCVQVGKDGEGLIVLVEEEGSFGERVGE